MIPDIDSKEFYELCQAYRNAPLADQVQVSMAFEQIKNVFKKVIEQRDGIIMADCHTSKMEQEGRDYIEDLNERLFGNHQRITK